MRYLVISFLSIVATTNAAVPSVTSFFPPGGQRGSKVTVTLTGKVAPWPPVVWTRESDLNIRPLKKSGQLEVTIAKDAVPGLRMIRIANAEGASDLRPFLIGTLKEINEKESNNDFRQPMKLDETMLTVNGQLSPRGDVDCFSLPLKKGQTLVASVTANEQLASPMDAVLQVLDEKGFVVQRNHDFHGLDPQLTFTAPRDGRYVIRLFCFPASPNSTIGFAGGADYVYRLTMTTGPYLEQVTPLAIQKPSDVLSPIGWNLPSGMKLSVDSKTGAVYSPTGASSAKVLLDSHPCLSEEMARSRALSLPVTISGRIEEKSEIDAFRIQATAKQRYVIQVDGPDLRSPIDPLLTVLDDTGKEILRSDDRGSRRTGPRDVLANWTAPKTGTFTVQVRDLYEHGGRLYFYRLRITKAEPDFALSVKSDRFTTKVGKPLEIPITISRLNRSKQAITLTAEGLPKTVMVMPVTSTGKTAKLKITASQPLSVPFRILGGGKSTGDLWLTVTK
mgnify:CR=1 FL=1